MSKSGFKDRFLRRVESRVSNGTGQCNFSGQRDRSSFIVPEQRDNGTSQKSCQGTGQFETAKIRDGPGQPKSGTGRAMTAKNRDGTRDKRDRAEKDVLKQKKDALKQKKDALKQKRTF
jgi:hypothetical protein